jgi:hypothetical protein
VGNVEVQKAIGKEGSLEVLFQHFCGRNLSHFYASFVRKAAALYRNVFL